MSDLNADALNSFAFEKDVSHRSLRTQLANMRGMEFFQEYFVFIHELSCKIVFTHLLNSRWRLPDRCQPMKVLVVILEDANLDARRILLEAPGGAEPLHVSRSFVQEKLLWKIIWVRPRSDCLAPLSLEQVLG